MSVGRLTELNTNLFFLRLAENIVRKDAGSTLTLFRGHGGRMPSICMGHIFKNINWYVAND